MVIRYLEEGMRAICIHFYLGRYHCKYGYLNRSSNAIPPVLVWIRCTLRSVAKIYVPWPAHPCCSGQTLQGR